MSECYWILSWFFPIAFFEWLVEGVVLVCFYLVGWLDCSPAHVSVICVSQIGNSLFDKEGAGIVQELLDKAASRNVKIHFPVDYVVGDRWAKDCNVRAHVPFCGGLSGVFCLGFCLDARFVVVVVVAAIERLCQNFRSFTDDGNGVCVCVCCGRWVDPDGGRCERHSQWLGRL